MQQKEIWRTNKIGAIEGNMTEYNIGLRNLVKDADSEIIISDEQIDENGKVMGEPVLVFATEGKRIGYMSILDVQKWIIHHIYMPEIKVLQKPSTFSGKYEGDD